MRLAIRLSLVALALLFASSAGAATLMYSGKWVSDSFGNDVVGGPTESAYFSVFGNPLGQRCNDLHPRCPWTSTPVDSKGAPSIFGGFCDPYTVFGPSRPAKGMTGTTMGGYVSTAGPGDRTPPFYRNKAFFTAGGAPYKNLCRQTTTASGAKATTYLPPFDLQRGKAMLGKPLTGQITANVNTATSPPSFTFPAAGTASGGIRRTTLGSFNNTPPYLYSYTYRTLRNDAGSFFAGGGPGSFSLPYLKGGATVAKVVVTEGSDKFGGTMRLLGSESGKVCFFLGGGCSLGGADWKYRYAGTAPTTTTYSLRKVMVFTTPYYNTANAQSLAITVKAERFPWTTGTVSVTAIGRGPHRTIELRKGFDKRTGGGKGTIQLVTPLITHWLQPGSNFETGGIAILRLPEPQKWMMLVAGLSLLGVLYRARPR
jgi:hypothetical protein